MKRTITARELTMIGIFTALTAVLAQIAILLPFTPIPISFGLVAVYITGIMLKPGPAVLTQVCYLLIGAIGIPVFGNFEGGIGRLFGPTGGYLFVYPLMAAIVSLALNSQRSLQAESANDRKLLFVKAAVSITLAHIFLYLGGTLWMCATTTNSFQAALTLAVYPYIPLDILKIIFCVAVVVPLRSRLMRTHLLTF